MSMRRHPRRSLRSIVLGASAAFLAFAGGAAQHASAADVTLSIWTGFPELVPYYQAVTKEYEARHPSIRFEILSSSLREMEQKLSTAVPTGTGPDIFDIGLNISLKLIEGGYLDANDADTEKLLKSGAWNKQVVDYFTVGGKTYGLPFMESAKGAMYYNTAMLSEAGISAPPKTFDELMAAGKKLVKFDGDRMIRSGVSMRLSGQGSGVTEKFRYVLEPAGGALIVPAGNGKWKSGFDNEAGRKAIQFYVDIVQNKVDDPKIQHDADAFVSGNTAILFREAFVIGEINAKNPSLKYGVLPIPAWSGARHMQLLPWGVYVTNQHKHGSEALDFTKFLVSKGNALRLTEMTGWLSARQDVDWAPLLAKTPQFATFVSTPSDVEFYMDPVLPVWDEIQTRMADKLTSAYVDPSLKNNPAKVAERVSAMAAMVDEILHEADLLGSK